MLKANHSMIFSYFTVSESVVCLIFEEINTQNKSVTFKQKYYLCNV